MIKARKSKELGGLIFGAYIEMNKDIYENCINIFKNKYPDFDMFYFALERTIYAYTTSLVMERLSQRRIKDKHIIEAVKVSHSMFFQGGVQPGENSIQDVMEYVMEIVTENAQKDLEQYFINPGYEFDEVRFLIIDAYMIEEPSDKREELSEILYRRFVDQLKQVDKKLGEIVIK